MSQEMTTTRQSLTQRMGERFGVEPGKLYKALKDTAFKAGKGTEQITDEQMMTLLIVADQYHLNPFTQELYAFPDGDGIVPVVGVDGWSRIINEHPQFDGLEFEQDEDSCTCTIYRKDRQHPVRVPEYMDECKRNTGPWNSHPRRMLRHKATIQAARLAFGYVGIYDQDEAERIVEATQTQPRQPVQMPQQKPRKAIQKPKPEYSTSQAASDTENTGDPRIATLRQECTAFIHEMPEDMQEAFRTTLDDCTTADDLMRYRDMLSAEVDKQSQ